MPQASGAVVSHRIQEIEDRTGSPAKSLHGALADSGNPEVAACPDEISETVARYYALTECGRLFHWRHDRLKEQAVSRSKGGLYFWVNVEGARWKINRKVLLDRLFPDRSLSGDVDWSEYDPNAPIPGLEGDPLEEKGKPDNSRILARPISDEGELERAHRLFYGE